MAIVLKANNGNIDLTSVGGKVIRGVDGGYYTPIIDAEGNLSWVASIEDMEDIAAVNIMGPEGKQGETGPQGERGEAFTYEDFTEEQLAALVGPAGKDGAKGDKGDTGEQGEPGVYVGATEPTDPEARIWINPEGGASTNVATEAYVDAAIAAAITEVENGTY